MSSQDLAGALDHAVRQAGEPGNFDTVAFISAAGLDAAQENDLAGRLLRGDMDVLHRREKVGKLRQFVIMRGEKRTRADVLLEMLDDRPSNGQSIEGSRAAADFIEKNKARRCGMVENGRDFAHFHEECGAATRETIACADAREA